MPKLTVRSGAEESGDEMRKRRQRLHALAEQDELTRKVILAGGLLEYVRKAVAASAPTIARLPTTAYRAHWWKRS